MGVKTRWSFGTSTGPSACSRCTQEPFHLISYQLHPPYLTTHSLIVHENIAVTRYYYATWQMLEEPLHQGLGACRRYCYYSPSP